jgi:hypothetical protein
MFGNCARKISKNLTMYKRSKCVCPIVDTLTRCDSLRKYSICFSFDAKYANVLRIDFFYRFAENCLMFPCKILPRHAVYYC